MKRGGLLHQILGPYCSVWQSGSEFPLAELASAPETQQPAAKSVPEVQHSAAETAPAVQHSVAEYAPVTADSSTCSQPSTHTQTHA